MEESVEPERQKSETEDSEPESEVNEQSEGSQRHEMVSNPFTVSSGG